jgi:hypothetical protein
MERFPVLDLILRFGNPAAVVLALAGGALTLIVTWALIGWFAILAAAVVAGLIFVVAKSYVELVTLITEMLVPR